MTTDSGASGTSRVLIDLQSNGSQYEFHPKDLGLPETGLTAEAVIQALKESGSKTDAARDLDLFDEDSWSIYVQVSGSDGWTRAEW
ncbi:hypothetical protein [Nocardioides sp.]|uniref:hypothetical protein n=1 Tax=Nocardioides sp. TaxID=35761 RepID=UPI002C06743A|nr:hypothetical protein [Nocardioides sp.]HXH77154.1 hypothetical protein [Nocardioides sp.]